MTLAKESTIAVLIVDDDPTTRELFARTLRLEGYRVVAADDGHAAFAEVARQTFDAILLDVQMPLIDGLSVLKQLRASGVDTPVTIVTGDYFIADETSATLRELGATVKFKPLWVDELVDVVRAMHDTEAAPQG